MQLGRRICTKRERIPRFLVSPGAGAALRPIPGGCPIPSPIPWCPGHKHAQTGPAVAEHFPQEQVRHRPCPAQPREQRALGWALGAAGCREHKEMGLR